MKEIIIKSQKELDLLDTNITANIIIDSPSTTLICIHQKYINAYIRVKGSSCISVYGNCVIESAFENCIIKSAFGNCIIKSASGNCVIESAFGNCVIEVLTIDVKIIKTSQEAVIICIDHKRKNKTKHYIYRKKAKHDIKSFLDIYNIKPKNGEITLYKSVRPNNHNDYYTNSINYTDDTIVNCPDFDKNKNRECGGGLHLSPTPELVKSFNCDGIIKSCRVKLKNIVIHPYNITKVRCKQVKVIGIYDNAVDKG